MTGLIIREITVNGEIGGFTFTNNFIGDLGGNQFTHDRVDLVPTLSSQRVVWRSLLRLCIYGQTGVKDYFCTGVWRDTPNINTIRSLRSTKVYATSINKQKKIFFIY